MTRDSGDNSTTPGQQEVAGPSRKRARFVVDDRVSHYVVRDTECQEVIARCAHADFAELVAAALEQYKDSVPPQPRREVESFALPMEAELRANDHKPGWKKYFPLDLLGRQRPVGDSKQNQEWTVQFFDISSAGERWACVRGINPQLRCTVLHSTQHSADAHCAALNRELYEQEIADQERKERLVEAPSDAVGLLGEWVAARDALPLRWSRDFAGGLLLAGLLRELDGTALEDRARALIKEAARHAV